MVLNQLLPKLMTGTKLYSRVLRFFGIGESQLVTILADLIDNQTDPTLAPYAKTGEVTLRLSTKASSQEEANQALDILGNQILDCQTSKEFLYETSVMVMERRLAWPALW